MSLTEALQSASLSDPGRVRDHNEDCVESRPDIGLYVLADGMGGYNAGEVASGMATSLIADGLAEAWVLRDVDRLSREEAMALAERLIREQIARANTAIFTTSQNNPECAGMGTTLVVCLFYDNFVSVAHIGDSRLYRLRGDALEQVTRDHSLLQEQLDMARRVQEGFLPRSLPRTPGLELAASLEGVAEGAPLPRQGEEVEVRLREAQVGDLADGLGHRLTAPTTFGRGGDPNAPEFNYLRETDYCSGASLCIPRSLWSELGGFDELFTPAYYEDTDLAFRVRQHGYAVVCQPFSSVS